MRSGVDGEARRAHPLLGGRRRRLGGSATRPAEWVLEDVIDGLVSIEAARELYGVAVRAVDEDAALYEVDEEETARLREARDTS